MKKIFTLFLITTLLFGLNSSQITQADEIILENGTMIPLKLRDNLSSKTLHEGDIINFITDDDIKLNNEILIKEGTNATGYISELTKSGRIGKAGEFSIKLDKLQLKDGTKVPLTGQILKKGKDRVVVALALTLCLPPSSGIFFLLIKGTDATLPAGYKVQARVDRDTTINLETNKI